MEHPKLHRYADDRIEVTYNARRCIHASECVQGLPAVFERGRRPWIMPGGASADEIVAVIERCPSGALHYTRLDGGANEVPNEPVVIEATRNGPLYVRGRVELRTADDSMVVEETRVALCRCGQSNNKPFCDNSHLRTGFAG